MSLKLKADRPDLGMRAGDIVMYSSDRKGLEDAGLYVIEWGNAEFGYRYFVCHLEPLTRKGKPRQQFFMDPFRFKREEIGGVFNVHRVIATYRHECAARGAA